MRGRASFASSTAPVGRFGGGNGRSHKATGLAAYWQGLKYAMSLIWAVRPGYIVLNLLNTLWNIPARTFDVLIVQYVIDTAMNTGDFMSILIVCLIYGAFMLVYHACTALLEHHYNIAAADRIRSDIQLRLHDQARVIDLAAFDTKEFYDDFARALDVLDERVIKCFKDLTSVLGNVVSIITLAGVMVLLSPGLIVVVVVGCLVTVAAYTKRSEIAVLRNLAITPLMRRFQYLNDLYYQRQYAKDVRVERIDEIARGDHRATADELERVDKRFGLRTGALTFVGLGAGSVTDVCIYLYLAWGLISGALAAGSFMALWNAAVQFSNAMKMLFRAVPELGETCLLIADVIGFDKDGSTIADPSPEREAAIVSVDSLGFDDVTFSYVPGKPVLRNVSFEVERGQMLAIVGHNGAGKSTIAKLLLRLYDPDSGVVRLNGLPYGRYAKADLRSQVAVVFQDHCHYAYSIAENVLMRPLGSRQDQSDCSESASSGQGDCDAVAADEALVEEALARVGLLEKVRGFEAGIHAHVTREFSEEGELFSGGELQKLAIARALVKDAPIVIFDEASSALDPIAEREVIDMMADLFADKVCIVVSHRLSMTRDADCILVLDDGRIVERG
ncbi:MAG: ABC transporter ATP-binding protein, partial [Eggerthellaceae bacterium]|nr:ABC transporter ATP-binding protein [Eggerthellaceae bacterium]